MKYYDFEQDRMGYGSWPIIAARFSVGIRTIKDLMKDYWDQMAVGTLYPDLAPASRKNCGVHLQLTEREHRKPSFSH
jgi:hypothetical protein